MNHEEQRVTEEFTCRSCQDHVSGYAALDPIEIDGYFFCDHCASNYMALRMDGYLRRASDMTKVLVKAVDDENYHKAWQQEFDKANNVKHI